VERPVRNGWSFHLSPKLCPMGTINHNVKASIAAAVLLTSLLSGCSNNSETPNAQDPTPSQTETSSNNPTPSESESPSSEVTLSLDYDAEIKLADSELEREFLTIALASCKEAQTKGFVLTHQEGISYFRPASTGTFPFWPFDEVLVKDGQAGDAFYKNYPPDFFSPCGLEAAARNENADPAYLEHKVQVWASNSYGWSQHNGGASLDEIVFQVTDGLITRYGPYNNMSNVVSYGLSDEELRFFDQ